MGVMVMMVVMPGVGVGRAGGQQREGQGGDEQPGHGESPWWRRGIAPRIGLSAIILEI